MQKLQKLQRKKKWKETRFFESYMYGLSVNTGEMKLWKEEIIEIAKIPPKSQMIRV